MENVKKADLNSCGCFEHYISLGHCCYVAIELEKLGLRDSSMPFDWLRIRWKGIERSFNTRFDGYLDYDSLYQKTNELHVYKNIEYGVGFVHDFVSYKSLKSQIAKVQEKYKRRIDRFFEHITSPTLFIRYCWDYDELVYVAEHYDDIEKMIKRYNNANEIVFISHNNPIDIDVNKIKFLFFITKGDGEELNATPISECRELMDYLSTVDYKNRERNLKFNKDKLAKKKVSFIGRIKKKYEKQLKKRKYIHDKQR